MGMTVGMVFLLWSMNVFIKAVGLGKSSCSGAAAVCGSVTIPYPFGIKPGCYIDDSFAIDCNNTLGSAKPFLRRLDMEVPDISLEGTLRVNYPMSWWCPYGRSTPNVSLASSPFVFSKLRNIFVAMGCANVAYLLSSDGSNSSLSIYGGCMSVCEKDTIQSNGRSCNGIGCCKTTIPSDLDVFTTIIQSMSRASFQRTEDCKYAFLVDQKWFEENLTNHFEVQKMSHVPVVLNWEINANLSSLVMGSNSSHSTCQFANSSSSLGNMSSTFTCSCDSGFEGNPDLGDGCQEGTLRVNYPMSWWCPYGRSTPNVSLASSPFVFSKLRNIFVAMGCANVAYLLSSDGSNSSLSIYGGCMSVCEKDTIQSNGRSCNGIGCCKTTIPSDLDVFTPIIQSMSRASFQRTEDCKYAFLVDQKWFEENLTNHFEVQKMSHVPVVLNWEINANLSSLVMGSNSSHSTCQFANSSSSLGNMSSTFTCSCDSGFEGNPDLGDGCQGTLLALY
ncbi:wall-associated receptor kinase 4 [Quercus suber]|uniref:Wall-associated receptor kinase 4 n=1 Tax=Quercus suber TaxID=58331 RepID=A0AAW0MBA9_QUESU